MKRHEGFISRYPGESFTSLRHSLVMVVLCLAFFLPVISLFVSSDRSGIEVGFPEVLDSGWKFIHMREEHGDLPHVGGCEGFVPSGHAGVTDAGANSVENVPFGIVGRIGDEIRRRRVKRRRERGG